MPQEKPKSSLWDDLFKAIGNRDFATKMDEFNTFLGQHSYISGFCASQDDCLVLSKILQAPPNVSEYPHVWRWFHHIVHFPRVEQCKWPLGKIKAATAAPNTTAVPAKKSDGEDLDLFGEGAQDGSGQVFAALKAKKEAAAASKKKVVVNKSSLVIEIKPATADTDLGQVAKLAKEIQMEGLTWGEAVKKVPVAFGLFKLQLSCVVLDDIVNTTDITDQLEGLGMNDEQKERLRKRQECGDDDESEYEDDEDYEPEGLVQSAEIVSFNKL